MVLAPGSTLGRSSSRVSMQAQQAISLAGALAGYTSGGAVVTGKSVRAGALRARSDADLIVANADLVHDAPTDTYADEVRQSWIRGRMAHDSH